MVLLDTLSGQYFGFLEDEMTIICLPLQDLFVYLAHAFCLPDSSCLELASMQKLKNSSKSLRADESYPCLLDSRAKLLTSNFPALQKFSCCITQRLVS